MQAYIVTNTVNGHQYIGKTTGTVKKRWTQHVSAARQGSPLLVLWLRWVSSSSGSSLNLASAGVTPVVTDVRGATALAISASSHAIPENKIPAIPLPTLRAEACSVTV